MDNIKHMNKLSLTIILGIFLLLKKYIEIVIAVCNLAGVVAHTKSLP